MLEINDLGFSYRYRPIFKHLNFQVQPGELVHITGQNGSGKTTLMSILAGLRQATAGQIKIKDERYQTPVEQKRFFEYLPAEANALYGKMDAMDNLRFWLRLRELNDQDDRLISALQRWDLDHPFIRQHFPVERYSTGMKRRLALARVQLSEAPCWLLDEPLYGLDTKGIRTFQQILEEHLRQHGSAIVVSHDTQPLDMFEPRRIEIERRRPE